MRLIFMVENQPGMDQKNAAMNRHYAVFVNPDSFPKESFDAQEAMRILTNDAKKPVRK